MDGVVADFEQRFKDLSGMAPENLKINMVKMHFGIL
jgi:hypothetical protein